MADAHRAGNERHRDDVPFAVHVAHFHNAAHRVPAVILHADVVVEVDFAAVFADAEIQLVILIAGHALIKSADAVKQFALEASERHGINIAVLRRQAIGRVAHTQRRLEHFSNRLAHEAASMRFKHAARVVAFLRQQRFHRQTDVIRWVLRVRIQTDNDRRMARFNADVHRIRHRAVGIIQHDDLRMHLLHAMQKLDRAILRTAVHKNDLHLLRRIILRKNRVHAGGNKAFLVAHRQNNRNERQLHVYLQLPDHKSQ